MSKRRGDPAGWFGLAVLGLVIIVFFTVVRCRPDFFRDVTLLP